MAHHSLSKIPDAATLAELLRTKTKKAIGQEYGVADRTVWEWARKLDLLHIKREGPWVTQAPPRPDKSARPDKATLKKLLGSFTREQVGSFYNRSASAVQLWAEHYGITRTRPPTKAKVRERKRKQQEKTRERQKARERERNPTIECLCGCGTTFLKYTWHKGMRRIRRFVPGHQPRTDDGRVKVAERVAQMFNFEHRRQSATCSWSLDFSEEYLGEAYLALVEGDDPIERCNRLRVNRHSYHVPIDAFDEDLLYRAVTQDEADHPLRTESEAENRAADRSDGDDD